MSSTSQTKSNRYLALANLIENSSSSNNSTSPQTLQSCSRSTSESPAFDPLPSPRDLYSRQHTVIASMNQLRTLYSELLAVEATLPDNIVQELRAEMDIVWIRISDHEKALDENHNLQTIHELRRNLSRSEAEIAHLRERLSMVSRAARGSVAGLDVEYDRHDVRYIGPTHAKEIEKNQANTRADYLLSKDVKSWR